MPQDVRSAGVNLAEQLRFVARAVKAKLDATDACEQAGDGQRLLFPTIGSVVHLVL